MIKSWYCEQVKLYLIQEHETLAYSYNLQPLTRTIAHFQGVNARKFLPQNPKIFGLRTEGLFIGPSQKNQRIWCNFFSKSLWKVKNEVVGKSR